MGSLGSHPLRPTAGGGSWNRVIPTASIGPRLTGGSSELLITPADSGIVPATGLEANFTAYEPVPLPSNSSFQVSATVILGAYVAVFGIFATNLLAPTPFLAVFANGTSRTVALRYWPALGLTPGADYGFALRAGSGTNWSLSVNGAEFGGGPGSSTFDFGLSALRWPVAPSFSEEMVYTANPFTPPPVTVPLAMAFLHGSSWTLPNRAVLNTTLSHGVSWGIDGRLQNSSLAPGELESSSTIAPLVNGTPLWTGGPVPIRIGLTLSPMTAIAFFPVVARSTLTDSNGSQLAQVPVEFSDSAGSAFLPSPSATTGAGGSAQASFLAPNSSVPDLVSVSSAILGFEGSSKVTLTTSTAIQLFVDPVQPPSTAPAGGHSTISFRTTNASGGPVAGVLLQFATGGGGRVSPSFAVTAADGIASIMIDAPNVPTTLVVTATVQAAGYWGHGSTVVEVAAPIQPWWVEIGPWLGGIILGAVAITLIVAVVLRSRPARGLPQLPLEGPQEPPPPAQP